MSWELRKLGGSARLCLMLLAVCCNALLFALYATGDRGGYTMPQLRETMERADLADYAAELEEELMQVLDHGSWVDYAAIADELDVVDAAMERVQQAEDYPAFRAGLVSEAQLKLRLGMFEGFSARSLQRGVVAYEALAAVEPQPVFLGGAELLLSFRLTDALALLFPLMAGLTLLTHERGAGLVNLTRPTRYGRVRLYGRKLAAAVVLSTVGFVLLYGANVLLAGSLYGFSGFDAPAQSLYGFAACPYRLTVGQLLALTAGLKYLWLLCCTVVVLLLCVCWGNTPMVVGCAAVCGGVGALMASGSRLWLRNLSLWQLADGQALCREAVYLNLLGRPADRVLCGVGFLLLLTLAAAAGAAALYARTPGGVGLRLPALRTLPRPRHTRLAGHELYKALLPRCGAWLLLAFFAVIVLRYSGFTAERSEFEFYYRNYSEVLSGTPGPEKDAWLEAEQARFDELNQQLVELAIQYPNPDTFSREAEEIENQLRASEAFQVVRLQYEQLGPGQVYLYQSGYQQLLGGDALRQDVLELGGAFLALTLLLSGSFAGERESGVAILLRAAPRRRAAALWKLLIAGGYVLLLALGLWLPGLVTVQGAYGALDMAAQANSVQCISTLSDVWTVGGVVLALLLGRLLLLLVAAAVVMGLSRRCGTIPALLLALLLLLLPTGVLYAGI